MSMLRIQAEGRRSSDASGSELIIVAWSQKDGDFRLDPGHFDDAWLKMPHADIGNWRKVPVAMKSETGMAAWRISGDLNLFLLTHPWSGISTVDVDGKQVEIDLYSPSTSVKRLNASTLSLTELSPGEIDELAFVFERRISANPRRNRNELIRGDAGRVDDVSWTLWPIGRVIIDAVFEGGRAVDPMTRLLTPPPRPFYGDGPVLVANQGGGWTLRGEASLMLAADAKLTLRRGPDAGTCIVNAGDGPRRFSLHKDVAAGPAEPIEISASGLTHTPKERHFLLFEEDRYQYADLLPRIDPTKPVALHVPRWKGVTSSTLNLFDQVLPIPLFSSTPPEGVTDNDITRYSNLLLSTGARHFVISGGDTFFIRLIRAVQRSAPEARFDLLWHSNWVQMGEPHDWATLKRWLDAWTEGLITRFGVVKEGLDEFLRGHGVDSIFIPNVIMIDPDEIRPSDHSGSIGIWLSGSSDYRKLPHAALMALSKLPNNRLKASGLNYVARRLINTLHLPVEKIWIDPIARMHLYREMADTSATLYVTLSECSPMLPLESFALGVPCLVGPASHLFRADPWLRDRLVVEDPLNPGLIARMLERVIGERTDIVFHYRDYAHAELARARAGVERLVA